MRILCEINADCVPQTATLVSESTTDFGDSRILVLALLGVKIIEHGEGCLSSCTMEAALSDQIASTF